MSFSKLPLDSVDYDKIDRWVSPLSCLSLRSTGQKPYFPSRPADPEKLPSTRLLKPNPLKPNQTKKHPQKSLKWISSLAVLAIAPLLSVGFLEPVSANSSTSNSTSSSTIQPLLFQATALKLAQIAATIAQVPPAVASTQQGTQIVLNGRSQPANWGQQQQKIGISDAGLMQTLGVSLLSSGSSAQQPVQWFSDPVANPIVLESWLSGQYRYLNIVPLAQRAGWQVQARGNTLQINTPASRVFAVRQGRQPWGDRIVVDLERPTPWQISEQSNMAVITLDATIDPSLAQNFEAGPGNRLTSLKVESNGSQTVIRAGTPNGVRPYIWTLTNPNRLVIDIREDSMIERDIAWGPGIRWKQQFVAVGNARFPVVSLLINPRQNGLVLKPIVSNPNGAPGIAPLSTTAQLQQAVAAINGGFFNRNNQLPLGAIRRDGKWLSGPILNRGAIAWNDAGEVAIGRLSLQEVLTTTTGQRIPVLFLNSGYVQAGVSCYTPEWGTSYTPIINNEVLITVQNDQVVSHQPGGMAGQRAFPIPANGYLVVVRANSAVVNALAVGTGVRRETATNPTNFGRFSQIMGAGPLLIQNRQIVLNPQSEQFTTAFIQQAAPRSAIATTADGNLLLVTVHNRVNGSGPTLNEIAQVMQRLGAVNALNLDGGSSTSLYLGGQLLNRSPRTAARVHNGIGVFLRSGS